MVPDYKRAKNTRTGTVSVTGTVADTTGTDTVDGSAQQGHLYIVLCQERHIFQSVYCGDSVFVGMCVYQPALVLQGVYLHMYIHSMIGGIIRRCRWYTPWVDTAI